MKTQAKLYNYYLKNGFGILASCLLLSAGINSSAFAESKNTKIASNKAARATLVAKKESKEEPKPAKEAKEIDNKNLFVVSDAEIQSFSNLSDVIEENKVLKEQRQVLLDHSRLLRDKYKKLYDYCAKSPNSCPLVKTESETSAVSNVPDVSKEELSKLEAKVAELEQEKKILEAGIGKAKEDIKLREEEVANLKKEHSNNSTSNEDLLKKGNSEVKDRDKKISEKDAELLKKNEELAKLQAEIENKGKSEKACLDQLETSSNVVMRIPELEGEIVSLKNQLLIKKTTAELLGVKAGDVTKVKDNSVAPTAPQVATRTRAFPQRQDRIDIGADVAIVEVAGDKVSLRVGPGASNSSLMDVQKGTRLTVEAREGEWLRVNAPTGGRAYINANYVRTFDKNGVLLSEAKMTEPVVQAPPAAVAQTTDEIQMNIDTPEPVKPPLPKKAPKKVAKANLDDKDVEPFGDEGSAESVAMEKLLKAMSQPEKKEQ